MVLSSILRALEKAVFATFCYFTIYWIQGFIVCYILAFLLDLELKGIWLGLMISMITYNLLQVIKIVLKIKSVYLIRLNWTC